MATDSTGLKNKKTTEVSSSISSAFCANKTLGHCSRMRRTCGKPSASRSRADRMGVQEDLVSVTCESNGKEEDMQRALQKCS